VKTIICIAARMNSKRLPQKSILRIQEMETIRILIRRAKLSKKADKVILCTSSNKEDKILIDIAKEENIDYVAGDELDVMERFLLAAEKHNADIIVRVTGDDVLFDPLIADKMIDYTINKDADYCYSEGLPKGVESEIIKVEALKKAYMLAEDTSLSEYMTYYLKRSDIFKIECLSFKDEYEALDGVRLTLDYPEDFELLKVVFNAFQLNEEKNILFDTEKLNCLFKAEQRLKKMNTNIQRENKPILEIKFRKE